MRLVCAPKGHRFNGAAKALAVVLYSNADRPTRGSAGAAINAAVLKAALHPAPKAWDFLSLALAVTAADLAGHRTQSPDGWTREFELEVAVADPGFWNSQRHLICGLLGSLTTDRWTVSFIDGGFSPAPPSKRVLPPEDCVALLSGGLDSFIGNIDLVAAGRHPFAISQIVHGDKENQRRFAKLIGGGLRHMQMNHNATVPKQETPPSQRARSLIFVAYGILAATTLARYHAGNDVTLYVCENGFISVNPPLTPMRLGSLSTRTTHPALLRMLQRLLDAATLRVRIDNPYQVKTKGEMLRECKDQRLLLAHAAEATSCSRYLRFAHTHCGRCIPCLVRRSAFLAWGKKDKTKYVYANLGRNDSDHAGFDDVRALAMALAEAKADGLDSLLGTSLSTALLGDVRPLQDVVARGLKEVGALLKTYGVK
jgi:7-cyano-7-deazaguanine synthase in queuosine biosynthesis